MSLSAPSFVGMENLNGVQGDLLVTCTYTGTSGYFTGDVAVVQHVVNADTGAVVSSASVSGNSIQTSYARVQGLNAYAADPQPTALCSPYSISSFYGQGTATASISSEGTGYYEWLPVVLGLLAVAVAVYFMVRGWDKLMEVMGLAMDDDAFDPWEHDEDFVEWHEERFGAEPMQRKKNWSKFHGL